MAGQATRTKNLLKSSPSTSRSSTSSGIPSKNHQNPTEFLANLSLACRPAPVRRSTNSDLPYFRCARQRIRIYFECTVNYFSNNSEWSGYQFDCLFQTGTQRFQTGLIEAPVWKTTTKCYQNSIKINWTSIFKLEVSRVPAWFPFFSNWCTLTTLNNYIFMFNRASPEKSWFTEWIANSRWLGWSS